MFEIKKETFDGTEVTTIHFADARSPYYPGCVEKWEVTSERCPDGWGYAMLVTVYNARGEYQFCDGGETYELWYKAKKRIGDYERLWRECKNALRKIGIKDFNITAH